MTWKDDRRRDEYQERRFGRPPRVVVDTRSALEKRQAAFDEMAAFFRDHGGAWLTSLRGAETVRFDALPDSDVPDALRSAGHDLVEEAMGERVMAGAIVEMVGRRADGTFVRWEEGCPFPKERRVYSGIIPVRRFRFNV
jgi:hypothetical protein